LHAHIPLKIRVRSSLHDGIKSIFYDATEDTTVAAIFTFFHEM